MNFLTNETWEIRNPFLQAFHRPGTRIYPTVELSFNAPLWHVDILHADETEQSDVCWRRFLVASIEQVLQFVTDPHTQLHQLSFQSNLHRFRDTKYEIQKVRKIIAATDPNGGQTYIIVGSSGKRFLLPEMGFGEADLQNKCCVYDCGTPSRVSRKTVV